MQEDQFPGSGKGACWLVCLRGPLLQGHEPSSEVSCLPDPITSFHAITLGVPVSTNELGRSQRSWGIPLAQKPAWLPLPCARSLSSPLRQSCKLPNLSVPLVCLLFFLTSWYFPTSGPFYCLLPHSSTPCAQVTLLESPADPCLKWQSPFLWSNS